MKMETRTGLIEIRKTFTARIRQDEMTLAERLNEAYHDNELEPEEREFLDLTREHFSRLDDE